MVYELKTKKYYGNAIRVLEITLISINSTNCEYISDSMVFNMKTDECANGSIWKNNGKLIFVTSDDMRELISHVKKHEILLVTDNRAVKPLSLGVGYKAIVLKKC